MSSIGVSDDLSRCTIDEERILQALLLFGWAHEGAGEAVRSEARQALDRLIAQGLPCRVVENGRFFNWCQVANFSQRDSLYSTRFVPCFRQSATALNGRAPQSLVCSTATRYLVSFRREFNLAYRTTPTQLRLRLPLPCEPEADVHIIVRVDPELVGMQISQAPGRLEVSGPIPRAEGIVAVEADIRFTVRPLGSTEGTPLSAPERERYTAPQEGMIQATDRIVELAEELAAGAASPRATVAAYWNFFFQHLRSGYLHYDRLDPERPLESVVQGGWFDCLTGSALLAALCRARDIPARVVGGISLYPRTPFYHYWAEVFLPSEGWLPFDLASWNLAGGERDNPWASYYFGAVDHRMTVECFPRTTIGRPGVGLPPVWCMLQSLTPDGTETTFHDQNTGAMVYRDRMQVQRLDSTSCDNQPDPT